MLLDILLNLILIGGPILYIVLCVKEWKGDKSNREARRKIEAETEKNRREFEEFARVRKKKYCEYLPQIYNSYSNDKLKSAHRCLSIMHYNDFKLEETECTRDTISNYWSACDELKSILSYPKWKVLNGQGGMDIMDNPLFPTEDMNYVYMLLRSRGVWR